MTSFIVLHVIAASLSLVMGPIVFFSPKAGKAHKIRGKILASGLLVTAVSGFGIYDANGGFSLFHGFSILTILTVLAGLNSIRRFRKTGKKLLIGTHYRQMAYGYMGLIIAGITQLLIKLPIPWSSPAQWWLIFWLAFVFLLGSAVWLIEGILAPTLARRYGFASWQKGKGTL